MKLQLSDASDATALAPTTTTTTTTQRARKASPRAVLRTGRVAGVALGAVFALGVAGCSPAEPPVETSGELTLDAPKVTVLDPGKDASVWEFVPADQLDTATQTVEVSEGFSQQVANDVVDYAALEQAPAGGDVTTVTLPLTTDGSGIQVADAPEADDLALNEDLASTKSFGVLFQPSTSGRIDTLQLQAPAAASDQGRAIVEGSLMRLLSLPVIFPSEPCGVGCRWQVESRVTGEATLLQTTTYTMESKSGSTAQLAVEVQQRPSQAGLDLSVAGGDGELKVLSSNTTSTGRLTVDSHRLLPVAGKVAYTTRTVYGTDTASPTAVIQDKTTAIDFTRE